jgi:hypothetical protein
MPAYHSRQGAWLRLVVGIVLVAGAPVAVVHDIMYGHSVTAWWLGYAVVVGYWAWVAAGAARYLRAGKEEQS